jgi:glutamine cyclotransferase
LKNTILKIILLLFILAILARYGSENKAPIGEILVDKNVPAAIQYSVVKTYPHDTTSFTEGLLVHQGKLYESTGSPKDLEQTRSLVGEVDLNTGKIDKRVELDRQQYFGEGIVFLKDKLYQLTYQTKVGFVYDARTFRQLGTFSFPSAEGWGMTTDGTHLIMSDGTNQLTFLDPVSFKVVKLLHVNDQNGSLDKLNELEYIQGFIYANVYTTAFIVKIDPTTGNVLGKMDFTSLGYDAINRNPQAQEMNGIAFDSTSNQMYVTGKFWANIYQVSFNH